LVEESADGGGLLLIFGGESCKLLLQLANSLVLVAHFLDNDCGLVEKDGGGKDNR